jgi:hypothetical protein
MRGLVALEKLDLWALDQPLADLSPLLSLARLTAVSLNDNYFKTPANEAVLASLQRRGVNTTVLEEARARSDAQYRARQLLDA